MALLRFYGHLDSLYRPGAHYVLQAPVWNKKVVHEMKSHETELPLYFEIDLPRKQFKARPKALRVEDIITI